MHKINCQLPEPGHHCCCPCRQPRLIRTRTATAAAPRIATAPRSHSNRVRWSSSHTYGEGSSHTNEYGGSTSHSAYGGTSHTNTYGGTTTGEAGYGATHTYDNGATAYHPPDTYYGYHPPTTVYAYHPPAPYYPGCYDCGSTAGAAAVGAAVGVVTGAAIASSAASSQTAAASQNAYAAGYNAGATTATSANANAAAANANMAAANANAAAANANVAAAGATGAAVPAHIFHGADRVGASRRLHHPQCWKRDLLPVRQYVVQSVVRCRWRVLQGGTDAVVQMQETSLIAELKLHVHHLRQTMDPFATTVVIFGCVFGGALLGMTLRSLLPESHFSSDSKEAVRLGMGLVATTVALVLGLLIASAKGFYDTQNTEMTEAAANVVLLDRILVHYGARSEGCTSHLAQHGSHPD